ncbi:MULTISPECIES: RimK family alpha-L-glutamate ligase [Streptomyces]|uniref:ATP-grasp domain-containing protein n=1 Tax=Streptomyces TaxID=1883 RepID=UPI000AA17481|nr:hypothetical protein [Streptomyces virginiae]
MIVGIISTHADIHALAVKREIEKSGVECHVFEVDNFDSGGEGLHWSPGSPGRAPNSNGEIVEIDSLDSVWFRRRRPINGGIFSERVEGGFIEHVASNTAIALPGIFQTSFRGAWVDHPTAVMSAGNKILQLHAATEAGLRIPRTIVSQDPDRVRDFFSSVPAMIAKPLHSVPGCPSPFVGEVTAATLQNADQAIKVCPTIYQELIPGERHLRVHCFGRDTLTAALESTDVDWRKNLNIPAREYLLPEPIEKKIRKVMRNLGITMGVVDLKLTGEGEPVWLEVNPQGQFLFIEAMCGLPLISSMARSLISAASNR